MLVAHGTVQEKADIIESEGYFQEGTSFLKLKPNPKLAYFGTACFAFRISLITWECMEKYCKQDLIIKPFRSALGRDGIEYLKRKDDNDSFGLIYILDVEKNLLRYPYSNITHSFLIPTEVESVSPIPTESVIYIITQEKHQKFFSDRYKYETKSIESLDLGVDNFFKRVLNTIQTRVQHFLTDRL